MKKIILVLLVISVALLASCKNDGKKADAAAQTDAGKTEAAAKPAASASYAFGVAIGNSLKETSVTIDFGDFLKGIKDVMVKNKPAITVQEAGPIIQAAIKAAEVKAGEANLVKEKEFLEKNGKRAGVVTTASGLQYEVVTEGTGASPKPTDVIKVDYVGTLLDGSTFDSSIERGQPAEFPLNQVIPGWTEGIQLMKVGGKAKLYIPSTLAYGASGAGGKIGPNSTLIFEVDLLEIMSEAKQ